VTTVLIRFLQGGGEAFIAPTIWTPTEETVRANGLQVQRPSRDRPSTIPDARQIDALPGVYFVDVPTAVNVVDRRAYRVPDSATPVWLHDLEAVVLGELGPVPALQVLYQTLLNDAVAAQEALQVLADEQAGKLQDVAVLQAQASGRMLLVGGSTVLAAAAVASGGGDVDLSAYVTLTRLESELQTVLRSLTARRLEFLAPEDVDEFFNDHPEIDPDTTAVATPE
jgi:hypothetical protein